MSLIRYNPADFTPVSFSHLVDKFFNDSAVRAGQGMFVPKVDVIENEGSYELHVEAPGMNKEDFNIELNDSVLTVQGERKFTAEKKEKNFHSLETKYGTFSRTFTLPENVDATKIEAKYANGILELVIPKDEKKAKKATIKIN